MATKRGEPSLTDLLRRERAVRKMERDLRDMLEDLSFVARIAAMRAPSVKAHTAPLLVEQSFWRNVLRLPDIARGLLGKLEVAAAKQRRRLVERRRRIRAAALQLQFDWGDQ